MIEIEKNVPMPAGGHGCNKALLEKMEATNGYFNVARRIGIKLSSRKVEDGKYRIWRIA